MGKLYTPENVASGFQTNNSLNDNFAQIEYALDACLARTGDAPNNMLADLDMDSHDILNVGTIDADILLVDGAQVPSLQEVQDAFTTGQATLDSSIATAQTAIDASVTAAQTAETNAETAQTAAETAQAAAAASAAGVDLPSIVGGDAGKILVVKDDETGYQLESKTLDTDTTYTVGTGGDFADFNDALAFVSKLTISKDVLVTLQLLTGEVIADTILLDGGDYSQVRLSSVDATVTATRSTLTGQALFHFVGGVNAPEINMLVNMDTSGVIAKTGLLVEDASKARVAPFKGITGVGGLINVISLLEGSILEASQSDFSSANSPDVTLYAFGGSAACLQAATLTGASTYGVWAQSGSVVNVSGSDVSGTGVTGQGVFASDCSRVDAGSCIANGRDTGVGAARASMVDAKSMTMTAAGTVGVIALEASTINAGNIDASSYTTGFQIETGSHINASGTTGSSSTVINSLSSSGVIYK